MNATTIHFVQDNQLTTNHSSQTYNWSSNVDNNISCNLTLPMQQLHYVESNLTLTNHTSNAKLIQMNSSEHLIDQKTDDNQTTYLTPLINVTLTESMMEKSINKLLPITINSSDNYNHSIYYSDNNNTLPSMAASFGSSIFVQSNCVHNSIDMNQINNQNIQINSNNENLINNQTNKSTKKLTKLLKNDKEINRINWTTNSKPGRRPITNKLNEQKLKYSNELNLNSLTKITKKTSQTRGRKRLLNNLNNTNLISNLTSNQLKNKNSTTINSFNQTNNFNHNKDNLSNATNNLCNLNSTNLNNSTNSINSSMSLISFNSLNSDANLSTRSKKSNDPNDPTVKRRNARERMRVKQLNDGYQNLRAKIPNSSKKMSKVQTLRSATQYIKNLVKMLEESKSYNLIDSRNNSINLKQHDYLKITKSDNHFYQLNNGYQ